jgi:hypothetical protein
MESKLSQLLTGMKRYGEINNEDIPILVKEIEDLQASEKLAWAQLSYLEKQWNEGLME